MQELINKMEDTLGYNLGRTFRVLQFALQKYFDELKFQISTDEWTILVHLLHKACGNQQWLTHIISKDKATITRIIDGLETKNFVIRVPDKEDRRKKEIVLTDRGKKFVNDNMSIIENKLNEFLVNISSKDYEITKKVLNKLSHNILDRIKK